MTVIKNPILRGFHPDPSIIRVEEDYYIATSTFEWWPGVKISHSRDLVHWETLAYALRDTKLLDLKGIGASQGVWAPCLTYAQGVFYLVYTIVNSFYQRQSSGGSWWKEANRSVWPRLWREATQNVWPNLWSATNQNVWPLPGYIRTGMISIKIR